MTAAKDSARLIFDTGPLSGSSVVVTRPADSARVLIRRIRSLGGTAIPLPGVTLRAAADPGAARSALRAAGSADIVVFASPAAVRYAFELLPKLRFSRTTLVCALGATSARALARRQVRTVLWPGERQDSEGLLALAPLQRVRGKKVVLLGSAGGRDQLPRTFRERRAKVAQVDVYQRLRPRFNVRQLAALENAAGPLITLLSSAEVLENLRTCLPLHLFGRLAAGELIVSSERLAALAKLSLFARVHIAGAPTPAALVDAACAALARHRL